MLASGQSLFLIRRGAQALSCLRRLAWLAALLLCLLQPLHAEQLSLREYGHAEGLGNLMVRSLVQDADGFLWAGTENGLYRFDGATFRRVGAEQGVVQVNSLAVQAGGVWVGTDRGLWLWRQGSLTAVPPGDARQWVVTGRQSLAPAADGGLWVVSERRLYRVAPGARVGVWRVARVFDEAAEAARPELRELGSVLASPGGSLWFGCAKALCRFHGGEVQLSGPEQGVPARRWNHLMHGSDGSLWARGGRDLLQMARGTNRFVQRADASLAEDELGTYPLVEDAQHRVMTATRGTLLRWNGSLWERFGATSGLTFSGRLSALLVDRQGGLWMGALGAGVMQWRGYGWWENWSVADGLQNDVVWSFRRAGPGGAERLHLGTGKGVAVFDAAARAFHSRASVAASAKDVLALASGSKGSLWAGTVSGQVIRLLDQPSRGGPAPKFELPEGDLVLHLWPDGEYGLLISGLSGVYRWRAEQAALGPQRVDGGTLGKDSIGDACRDPQGRLWVGAREGLGRYENGQWHLLKEGSGTGVLALACLRDGGLLVADESGGLQRITVAGEQLQRVSVMPASLQGRAVVAMLEDRRGWWWLATDAGVAVSDGQRWRLLDQRSGLAWNDTSGRALYEDADGSIWIGTSRGASHMLAPEKVFDAVTGAAAIEAVHSGTQALPISGGFRLPWSRDALEVVLSAPVYRLRTAMQLEYRVLGFDDRWAAAPADVVRLAGLPAGAYRFEARVVDHELGVASPATGFAFEIEPPWWQTPVAYALALLVGLGAVVLGHRWRVRRVVLHAQRLQVLVRERTQELEASQEQLRELAMRDGLTGAWNRRALMETLEREVARARRERVPLTLVMADIDHFKRINDGFGHQAGDQVLREFVSRLSSEVRSYDAVGRYGGEEFVLLLPGLDMSNASDRERLSTIHAVVGAAPMPPVGRVTCSFGAVTLEAGAVQGVEALIAAADEALYRAKKNGRDRVECAAGSHLASNIFRQTATQS